MYNESIFIANLSKNYCSSQQHRLYLFYKQVFELNIFVWNFCLVWYFTLPEVLKKLLEYNPSFLDIRMA